MPQSVTGTFTATGNGQAIQITGPFNLTLWGTFVATVALERSFDGTTWHNCTKTDWTPNSFTGEVSLVIPNNPENGVFYRLRCSSYTSGTVNWRLSQ